jgi:hypothetical protein
MQKNNLVYEYGWDVNFNPILHTPWLKNNALTLKYKTAKY